MAFVIDAFAVADEQDLGRFMLHEEIFGYFVGNGPVPDEIKKVEINGFRLFGPFEAAFYEGAGGATGTVFEDELGTGGGTLPDLFQLGFGLQGNPIHAAITYIMQKGYPKDNLYKNNFLRSGKRVPR
jgi:hypothetical protein